jgi:ABC-type nitrate/sulfonate/bicarbonate transport system substrate-binding protein
MFGDVANGFPERNDKMINMRRLFFFSLLLVTGSIAILSFSGCGQKTSAPVAIRSTPRAMIRLGYRPQALADVTPVVIKEQNLDNSALLEIQFVPLSSPDDGFTKFKAHEIDAIAGMPMEKIFQQLAATNQSRKFEAYYFQLDVVDQGWVSLVGSKTLGIHSISDLAGKNVASLNTEQAQYLLREIMLAAGIPKQMIKLTKYNPATALAGLRSGEYAALFGLEPAISMAADEGNPILAKGPVAKFLFGGRSVPVSASLIADDFLQDHPDAKKEFLSIMAKSVDFVTKHPQEVRSYFEKREYGELKPSVATKLNLPTMEPPNAALQNILNEFVARLVKDGLLNRPVDIAPLFPK